MKVNVFGTGLLPASARRPSLVRAAVLRVLAAEKASAGGELNVVILDRARMKKLNLRFLAHGHDTDVIAFDYGAAGDGAPAGDAAPFGDVYISAFQARAQARQMGHSVLTEVLTLAVHGTLHLLGYEDSTPRKKAAMFKKQDALIAKIQGPAARR